MVTIHQQKFENRQNDEYSNKEDFFGAYNIEKYVPIYYTHKFLYLVSILRIREDFIYSPF